MKKIFIYLCLGLALSGIATSCSDFGDVNTDPEHLTPEKMDYTLMFSQVEQQACGSDWDVWRNGLIYSGLMIQHLAGYNWDQGEFYTWSDLYNAGYWNGFFSGERGSIRNVVDIMNNWRNKPQYMNEYQMARIMKVYIFQKMTDLYGDVPYSEAGRAYSDNILYPKYDKQEDIYMNMLNELQDAQSKLSAGASSSILGKKDIIFGGKLDQWKKFANSLMLRVAMRLTKVKPDVAEEWAKKAVANGVITSNIDNAMIKHSDAVVSNDSAEPYGKVFTSEDPQSFYISDSFLKILKDTQDPRIPLICCVCNDTITNPSNGVRSVLGPKQPWGDVMFDPGNPDPQIQKGFPVGWEKNGDQWDLKYWPSFQLDSLNSPLTYPDKPANIKSNTRNWKAFYSVPNRRTYARPDAPTLFVTNAETQLLMAEAAYRGWITGSAADYYKEGVTAAMHQFSVYDAAAEYYAKYLSDSEIAQYWNNPANQFNPAKALEQINTQYYITTFCDEYEAFSNWRRSGFPALTPINKNYPNNVTNGTIPRRFTYPMNEDKINHANYANASSRMAGGDKMTSRVWWDTQK